MPALLLICPILPCFYEQLAAHFTIIDATNPETRDSVIKARGKEAIYALSIGTIGFTEAQMQHCPNLKLVAALGVGHEGIASAYAKSRGIATCNGAGTNSDCVADHALALLLSLLRRIPFYNAQTKQGKWRLDLPIPEAITGKKIGILGMGNIGQAIATRLLPFKMDVAYANRSEKPALPYPFYATPQALAEWCDVLIIALPGGKPTYHLIDDAFFPLLKGKYLINVGRGSIIDTAALEKALAQKWLAGVALDVYESEPEFPASLAHYDELIVTPHIGGDSIEAKQNAITLFLKNIAHLEAGKPLITPI